MRRSIVKPSAPSASYQQHDVTLLQRLDAFFTQFISVLVSPTTQKVVLRSAALTAVLFASVAAACVAYLSFYWRFIPNLAIENDVYLQYGYSRPPFAIVTFKPDTVLLDQPYDIVLDLQVPLSPANLNLGNFMTVLDLKTAQNETVYYVSRPATILQTKPTRSWLPLANRGTPLSIQLGLNEVLQRKRFTSHVSHAYLEVGRQDGYQTSAGDIRELQIYAAKLRFHAVFHGLRWFMYNYRLTAFATFTTLFLFSELFAVLFVWSIISYRRSLPGPEVKQDAKAQMEQADKEEQEEFERLQVKSSGRSMGKKGGVLSALKDISSEEEVVEVEEVKAESEDEGWANESKDNPNADEETVGGSVTSGEASSMGTFNSKSTSSSGSSKSTESKNKDV